jgi:acyl-CoA synthetase (AMP-forming)/AMP-acid ligase II
MEPLLLSEEESGRHREARAHVEKSSLGTGLGAVRHPGGHVAHSAYDLRECRGYVAQRNGQRSAREDILASVNAVLADYKVPERFEIVSEMPRNGLGGIDRKLLRGTMASAKSL